MNQYTDHIEILFRRLLDLRHIVSHINSILINSVKKFENIQEDEILKDIDVMHSSALIIKDWSSLDGHGKIHHTGVRRRTYKNEYKEEVDNIISQECCYAIAQSFEALEKFVKDCIFTKIENDIDFRKKLNIDNIFKRADMPDGQNLFKFLKKACSPLFNEFSRNNNSNIFFSEYWYVLSQTRHSITHSSSIMEINKMKKSKYIFSLFRRIFYFESIDSKFIKLQFDYQKFLNSFSLVPEFAFQIFKMLSMKEKLDWEILK